MIEVPLEKDMPPTPETLGPYFKFSADEVSNQGACLRSPSQNNPETFFRNQGPLALILLPPLDDRQFTIVADPIEL